LQIYYLEISFEMLTKKEIQIFQSLHQKKSREEYGLFLAEGHKITKEIIEEGLLIERIITSNSAYVERLNHVELVDENTLKKISQLKTAGDIICIAKIPNKTFNDDLTNKFVILLDDIQDPGNLGTIIRTADWFGIQHIFCSENTVDIYNPKVIQASMGSFLRVNVKYLPLVPFVESYKNQYDYPVYASGMHGVSVFDEPLKSHGLLMIGNEGKGLSSALFDLSTCQITIPKLGKAESLNAAVATGILCAHIK
jgi:RNA methyltransferase, TrmH family